VRIHPISFRLVLAVLCLCSTIQLKAQETPTNGETTPGPIKVKTVPPPPLLNELRSFPPGEYTAAVDIDPSGDVSKSEFLDGSQALWIKSRYYLNGVTFSPTQNVCKGPWKAVIAFSFSSNRSTQKYSTQIKVIIQSSKCTESKDQCPSGS